MEREVLQYSVPVGAGGGGPFWAVQRGCGVVGCVVPLLFWGLAAGGHAREGLAVVAFFFCPVVILVSLVLWVVGWVRYGHSVLSTVIVVCGVVVNVGSLVGLWRVMSSFRDC